MLGAIVNVDSHSCERRHLSSLDPFQGVSRLLPVAQCSGHIRGRLLRDSERWIYGTRGKTDRRASRVLAGTRASNCLMPMLVLVMLIVVVFMHVFIADSVVVDLLVNTVVVVRMLLVVLLVDVGGRPCRDCHVGGHVPSHRSTTRFYAQRHGRV